LGEAGVEVHFVGALVRDLTRPRGGPDLRLTSRAADVLASGADVIIEVLGGREPARALVAEALDRGVHVVTANKTLVAHDGDALRAIARARHTTFAYEASVLAGVP